MDWPKLIRERNEWVAHNFPQSKLPNPQESILGVIEELGELSHAHLKELQGIRGTNEEHQANAKDAIGDITVYLLGVMNHNQLVPDEAFLSMAAENALSTPQGCIFWAARWAGSLTTLPAASVDRIVGALQAYCKHRGWDYEQLVIDCWTGVSQRDWIADPVAGGE